MNNIMLCFINLTNPPCVPPFSKGDGEPSPKKDLFSKIKRYNRVRFNRTHLNSSQKEGTSSGETKNVLRHYLFLIT